MQKIDAKVLLEKYKLGTCSDQEKDIVETWYQKSVVDHPEQLSEEAIDNSLERIWSKLNTETPIVKATRLWPRIAVAAAIAVVVFGAGLWYYGNRQAVNQHDQVADIAPGRNGATLTLANGKKIYISDSKAGRLAEESGVSITKAADGQIIYTAIDNASQSGNAINTLQTANGEQTQIRLPDGTVVYLNSASSLKYPASFAKLAIRRVELSGEGYFKVSKDRAHPFIVKTEHQEVEVLGTEFNINSYAGDPTSTTLLEGSVRVIGANKIVKVLKPNQQAVYASNNISVSEVEAQFYTDWKEGFFMFNNESLESIMKRVARWYNVKVIYSDPDLKRKTFVGTISKFDHISSVIKSLEGTGLAKFKIDNNILTISAKE